MKQYLLIDIGGTFIKYSLADEQARKISGGKVPTPLTNMDDLLAAIEGFAAPLQGQFVGCAISMPGRIDTRNGIAHTGGMLSAFMWPQQRRVGPVHWPVWRMALCWCWAPASAAVSS